MADTPRGNKFYVIQDPGDEKPHALIVAGGGLFEWWTGPEEGWVDTPYFAAYFFGEPGASEIPASDVEAWKATIQLPTPGAVRMLRAVDSIPDD